MISGSSFTTRVSLSSDWAGCHCSPFSHVLLEAKLLMLVGDGFATHVSLSSARAGCHYPFLHALIRRL